MPTNVKSSRSSQIMAWFFTSLFILGFFLSSVGAWTGPILGAWFVGTQKPRRGFLWMLAFSFIPSLIFGWRNFPLTGPVPALEYLAWTLLATVLGVLPFTFHRLVSPRLPGFLSTLPLPLAAVAIPALALALHIGAASMIGPSTFLIFWFAATVVWLWNQESHATPNLSSERAYRCRRLQALPPLQRRRAAVQSAYRRDVFLGMPWRSPVPERMGALPSAQNQILGRTSADHRSFAKPIYARAIACGQRAGP